MAQKERSLSPILPSNHPSSHSSIHPSICPPTHPSCGSRSICLPFNWESGATAATGLRNPSEQTADGASGNRPDAKLTISRCCSAVRKIPVINTSILFHHLALETKANISKSSLLCWFFRKALLLDMPSRGERGQYKTVTQCCAKGENTNPI